MRGTVTLSTPDVAFWHAAGTLVGIWHLVIRSFLVNRGADFFSIPWVACLLAIRVGCGVPRLYSLVNPIPFETITITITITITNCRPPDCGPPECRPSDPIKPPYQGSFAVTV